MERGWKPNDDHHHHQITPNCPRCGCSNTKFCYYNNYSLTQPRYFCKGCRRYWTKGGSLRNVPVGGGCRKNRRGKSLRLSTTTTEGALHSKSLGYGGCHSGTVGHNSYGINSSLGADNSACSAVTQDGSRIDLALVYANFLNQKPESKTGSDELPELPSEFDSGLDFSSIANMNINGGNSSTSIQLMEENGVVGSLGICHTLSDLSIENCSTNDHMYFSGLDPIFNQKQQHHHHQEQRSSNHDHDHHVQYALSHDHDAISDFGLPPLPGQEALWSSTSQMSMASHHHHHHHHHPMQAATVPLLGVPADQAHDPNLLIAGSWSPFDLPCNEAFSRT